MAKSRRVAKSRTPARKPARTAKKRVPADRRRVSSARTPAKPARPVRAAKPVKAPARAAKPVPVVAAPPPPPAPPAPRKPTYHEAVAMYERGLQALQRRDFAASADALRSVIERYPDERELLERARLYLKVCERELEPKEPAPKTAVHRIFALYADPMAARRQKRRSAHAAPASPSATLPSTTRLTTRPINAPVRMIPIET